MNIEDTLLQISKTEDINGARVHQTQWTYLTPQQQINAIVLYLSKLSQESTKHWASNE